MEFNDLRSRLRKALAEDRAFSDVTTRRIPPRLMRGVRGTVLCKQSGVFCGAFLLSPLFRLLNRKVRVRALAKDGTRVRKGQSVAEVRGPAGAVLAGERVALNLITHLSGISTLTRRFVDAVKGTGTAILDTRKTTPLWRDLEKYAVRCGGGRNHRFSLGDAMLIKDNHLSLLRMGGVPAEDVYQKASLGASLRRGLKFIAMEASTIEEVWTAIRCRVDIVLLDNMPPGRLAASLALVKAARTAQNSSRPLIEISGGIGLAEAKRLSRIGVDRVSIGALTHSAPVLDFSLEVN
jgi:nicotinate-nucleotide pyrophosphorylase (carboxylating)